MIPVRGTRRHICNEEVWFPVGRFGEERVFKPDPLVILGYGLAEERSSASTFIRDHSGLNARKDILLGTILTVSDTRC